MTRPTDLTPAQWEAVDHFEGPLLVLAGPGSGKTRVITRRIARLIERGVFPRQILAITFTNKAAKEMDARVQALLPGSRVWVSTFHRLCARLLRRYAPAVGLQPNFTILDQTDQKAVLRGVLTDLDLDPAHYSLSRIAHLIGQAKNQMQSAEAMAHRVQESAASFLDTVIAKVYTGYQQALLASNAVDFDDLLLHVCTLLADSPDIRTELDERYRYILVDEYQDTNLAQYRIIAGLSQDHPNLCATGDPDQSIYGWRGAEIGNILRFEHDFPSAQVVRLEQNYRSTKAILDAAGSLISHNIHRKKKSLFTDNATGSPAEVLHFADETQEAEGIAQAICRMAVKEQRPWSDFALFYRVNALSRGLETALARHAVPFQVASGVAFFERAEIKDLLAYLRIVFNPADQTAFFRAVNTPLRGIGKGTQSKLAQWAARQQLTLPAAAARADEAPGIGKRGAASLRKFARLIEDFSGPCAEGVAGLLNAIIDRTGYAEGWSEGGDERSLQRLANVEELITAAAQYDAQNPVEGSLEGFLEGASLVADVDAVDEHAGKVTLMTLHAAKGLEFPVVFVVAVEQNLLPHERALKDNSPHELEEERRLLFVGMTRARERLFLTQTEVRTLRGKKQSTIPSPFLREMDLVYTNGANAGVAPGAPNFDRPAFGGVGAGDEDDADDASAHEAAGDAVVFSEQDNAADPEARIATARVEASGEHSDSPSEEDRSLVHDVAPPHRRRRAEQSVSAAAESQEKRLPRLMTAADLLNGTVTEVGIPQSFEAGMSVRHPRLGLGTVIETQGTGKWRTVTVEFPSGDRQKFVASKCPLQPVGLR